MAMMDTEIIRLEIRNQSDAIRDVIQGDESKVQLFIDKMGPLFRDIIREFEAKFHYVPTKDDLIWIASEKMNMDIRAMSWDRR